MRLSVVLLSLLMSGVGQAQPSAPPIAYAGKHPIPDDRPGSFCYLEVEHLHSYSPAISALAAYRVGRGGKSLAIHFVGDPADHGYEGQLIGYFGPHPISDFSCEILDSHFHDKGPEVEPKYQYKNGVYYYGTKKRALRTVKKMRRRQRRQSKKTYESFSAWLDERAPKLGDTDQ